MVAKSWRKQLFLEKQSMLALKDAYAMLMTFAMYMLFTLSGTVHMPCLAKETLIDLSSSLRMLLVAI